MNKKLLGYQKILEKSSIVLPVLAALMTSVNLTYESHQKGNEFFFFFYLIVTFIILSTAGIYILSKFIGPAPDMKSRDELKPLQKGPVGRKEQQDILLKFLGQLDNKVSLLILTGPSGSGKTSFINAGIIPNLKELGNNFFKVRLDQYRDFSRAIVEQIQQDFGNDNTYIEDSPKNCVQMLKERRKIPIFIFDQFEQLFMESSSVTEHVIDQIQQLLALGENVKIIIVVRTESFKDTVMSFYRAAKPGCSDDCDCQRVQIIDLPLLSDREAKEFLEQDLAERKYRIDDKLLQYVVLDLKKSGPGDKILVSFKSVYMA